MKLTVTTTKFFLWGCAAAGLSVVTAGLALVSAGYSQSSSEPETRSTYVLGPDDQISIRALHCEELSDKPFRISPDGILSLPMVGPVKAGGLTVPALEKELTTLLKTYYVKPEVTVAVTEFRSQPVSVIGSVTNPGVVQLQGRKTLLEIISLAGGTKPDAGSAIKITRSMEWGRIPLPNAHDDETHRFSVAEVHLKDLIDGRNPAENILIRPEDVVSIPPASLVYVVGEVKKSGGFVLGNRTSMTVLEALSLAEGLQPRAAPGKARILRAAENGADHEEVQVNVGRILAGKAPDVSLRSSDILFIPNSSAKSVTMRTMEAAIQIGTGLVIWR
jgi:polysaccharide export outer membrane protein